MSQITFSSKSFYNSFTLRWLSKVTGSSLVSILSSCSSLESWAATSYKSSFESLSDQGHVSPDFGSS